jgi:hypothetical protein
VSRRDARSGDGRRYGSRKKSLFQQLLTLSSTRPIFNADLYVIDGGSGKTRAVVDHNDLAHWLDQSDTTKQCALPAAHAGLGGALAFDINAAGIGYVSNRPGSAWQWMTDGAGYTGYTTMELHDPLTAGPHIWSLSWLSGGNAVNFTTNGAGSTLFRTRSNGVDRGLLNVATAQGPQRWRTQYDEAVSPELESQRDGAVATTATTAASFAGAPTETFWLGRSFGSANAAPQHGRSYMFFPTLDAAGQAIVQQYIEQDTGIAA